VLSITGGFPSGRAGCGFRRVRLVDFLGATWPPPSDDGGVGDGGAAKAPGRWSLRWDRWSRAQVRFEAVDGDILLPGAHLEFEDLGPSLQDTVGALVRRRERWQAAASPHVHHLS